MVNKMENSEPNSFLGQRGPLQLKIKVYFYIFSVVLI